MAHAIRTKNEATPEETIRAMAQQHGITAERTATDEWADNVTRLAGDEVIHDEIEDLLVTMQRKGVITDEQANALYGAYLVGA